MVKETFILDKEVNKMKYVLIVFIIALIALTGCQQGENTIDVAGNSEISADPDEAEIFAGISILKPTAEEAQAEANKVINDIIDSLKNKEISEDDIETERLNLYEEKTWENKKSRVIGWRATQTLKIKTTDLTKVGLIVDVCVSNGANQISSINFGLSEEKEQEYKQEALAKATKNAKAKAETIAESLGVRLGKIKTVSESQYYYQPYRYAMAEITGIEAVKESTQVLPKDVTVTANINLVYYVK